jgi:hypothetical protein
MYSYEGEAVCRINLTICSDLGIRLHLKALGVLYSRKKLVADRRVIVLHA